MAVFSAYREIAAAINEAHSTGELTKILAKTPASLRQREVVRSLLTSIRRICEEAPPDTTIDLEFVQLIIDETRKAWHNMGADDANAHEDWVSSGDSAYVILSEYAHDLAERTNGECFRYVERANAARLSDGTTIPFGNTMGLFFLVIRYQRWARSDQLLWKNLQKYIYAFLHVFADICVPTSCVEDAVQALHHVITSRTTSITRPLDQPEFPSWLIRDATMEFEKCLQDRYYSDRFVTEARDDARDIFYQWSNLAKDPELQERYFYEYMAMITTYYPMQQQREQIRARYERYYGDDTYRYMSRIYTAIMSGFVDRVPDDGNQVSTRRLHLDLEYVILHIRTYHSDVSPRVLENFIRDLIRFHSPIIANDISGAERVAYDMIAERFKVTPEDDNASVLESFIDTQYLPAMEADDYGMDHRSGVDNASMHKDPGKSRTAKAFVKYKENEKEVDSKLANLTKTIKRCITEKKQAIIINGKKSSIIGTMVKVLAGIGIFHYSKIAALMALVVNHYASTAIDAGMRSESQRFYHMLENELVMIDEKIQDASADGDRDAKYQLMRTKMEIEDAKRQLEYNLMGAKGPDYRRKRRKKPLPRYRQ